MADRTDSERFRMRLRLLLGLMLATQGAMLTYLWNLQVVRGHTFQDNIRKQSLRRIRHPGQRGFLYDRNQIILADNRPSHCIALYPEELRVPGPRAKTIDRIETLLDELSVQLQLPRSLTRRQIERHYERQRLMPLLAWEDLDAGAVARWAERVGGLPGIDLITQSVRAYPYGDLMAQTLGYVGRGGMAGQDEGPYDFYWPEMEGKAGLEKVFDPLLRGEAGGEVIRIDVAQYKHGVEAVRPAVAGSDIQLTIDARLQRLCERILNEETGSVVVMDPRNGDVLAMATHPRFDLNRMVPFISHDTWNEITRDPRKPLVNRPVREHYPPGSIIKPFVCLAGLVSGKVHPDTRYSCEGSYSPGGGLIMHCNNRLGHGSLDMRGALERSCNVYMWKLMEDMGYDPLLALFESIGLGKPSGVEVDYEVGGLVPTNEWNRQHRRVRLLKGHIANIAIGQGDLTVTPLQMAMVTAVLANGGHLHAPTLLRGIRAPGDTEFRPAGNRPATRELGWDPVKTEAIRLGMRDVVMGAAGTARASRVPGLDYAGKTGTAQYGPAGHRSYRSWMIAFAPYDNPRVAAVVLIDSGAGSGVDAAPRMKLLMQALFGGRSDGDSGVPRG